MAEVRKLLRSARETLGLDVAFISQFVDCRRVFRYVDAAGDDETVREGEGGSLDASLCKLVVDGRLPELVRDMRTDLAARALSANHDARLGAHLSVPIRLSDGTIFGSFCCFAHDARPALTERDLSMVRAFADVVAGRLEQIMRAERRRAEKARCIAELVASAGPEIVYQPVFMLDDLRVAGTEALSRFPQAKDRPIELWFKEARDVGLQVELELLAIKNALRGYRRVWQKHRVQLGLNASAATIADERLWQALDGYPRDLIVIELTEHEEVRDYAAVLAATKRLRLRGTKIAVDDVGAGYASMRHVLNIRPDILKLDVEMIRAIDSDDLKAALISSLKHFADQFGCRVVAEGVETREELSMLQHLGLQAAQGYVLGRPAGVDTLLARLDRRARRPDDRHAADAALSAASAMAGTSAEPKLSP